MAAQYEVDPNMLGGEPEQPEEEEQQADGEEEEEEKGTQAPQAVTVTPTGEPLTLKPAAPAAGKGFFESLGALEMAILVLAGVVGLLFLCLLLSYVYSGDGSQVAAVPPTQGL